MKGMITAEWSVQFTGNYLPCNIFQIDVWFFVICKLYGNLRCGELGPAMRSNGPLAQVVRIWGWCWWSLNEGLDLTSMMMRSWYRWWRMMHPHHWRQHWRLRRRRLTRWITKSRTGSNACLLSLYHLINFLLGALNFDLPRYEIGVVYSNSLT
jgi:hypothetical protein